MYVTVYVISIFEILTLKIYFKQMVFHFTVDADKKQENMAVVSKCLLP